MCANQRAIKFYCFLYLAKTFIKNIPLLSAIDWGVCRELTLICCVSCYSLYP